MNTTPPKKNWKADLPFSKLATMPKSDWKKDFDKFAIVDKREKPVKPPKPKKELKRTPLKPSTKPLKRTRIKQVGARTIRRKAEYGLESDMYYRKWLSVGGDVKAIICACGCGQEVKEPFVLGEDGKPKLVKPQCFAHILAKGMYDKFRYLLENIDIVATIDCHHKNDKKYNDLEKRAKLEKKFTLLLKKQGKQT